MQENVEKTVISNDWVAMSTLVYGKSGQVADPNLSINSTIELN
jgi:hypothetical protein